MAVYEKNCQFVAFIFYKEVWSPVDGEIQR